MSQITVPGKLIISGEHAVVYGNPALAAAIDRYVHIRLTPLPSPVIQFAFAEHKQPLVSLTFTEFWQAVDELQQRYQEYLQGARAVTEITLQLYDLPLYALGLFAKQAKINFTEGLRLTISGDLPMGYGLGSSAAVVVGVLRAASQFFAHDFTLAEMQGMAMQTENLQHGRSSGLDPSVCLHGGVVLYTQQETLLRPIKPWQAHLINTGQPISSTGECVSWVKQHSPIKNMLEEFKAVTLACDQALMQSSLEKLQQAIRENHRLLCAIGVVPSIIQTCIAALEKQNCAAKICGAGSIEGENVGYLLTIGTNIEIIESIAHEYGFTVERVQLGINV